MKDRIISSVTPKGIFRYGIHKPCYSVKNLRETTNISVLGKNETEKEVDNRTNFPTGDIEVKSADWIFEIPNPLPFRGRTFIDKAWADASAENPARICLPASPQVSFSTTEKNASVASLLEQLDRPMQLALATCSTDPTDLCRLARISCVFVPEQGEPEGLRYTADSLGRVRPVIHDHDLFEAVANNPHLPDAYRVAMVIRPGAQGASEIVGDYSSKNSHIYEYLRKNSYIAGGHYAANMADDTIRYSTSELSSDDIHGLRHLYYQRTFTQLAQELGLSTGTDGPLGSEQLEELRISILSAIEQTHFSATTLWGWNYGFDFAPTGYRLHASHQQIHQQYALIPDSVVAYDHDPQRASGAIPAYSCGDLVADWVHHYQTKFRSDFFSDYLRAIEQNTRLDGRQSLSASLVAWRDERVILFVPKAQTSQWELQIMTLPDSTGTPPGNILECDRKTRESLDTAILLAQKALAGLGVKMVTSIEFPKRIGSCLSQPLLYSLLPRLPQSPGAFSEAQLRFINGHYPEDFASRCREQIERKVNTSSR